MKYININTGNIFEDNEDKVLKLVQDKPHLKVYVLPIIDEKQVPELPKKIKKRSG